MVAEKEKAKKPRKSTTTRGERIDALVADLRKRYPGRVMRARDYTAPWVVRRCPFGILDLDIALQGGAPAGGMTVLVSQPNEGKNFLLCRAIAMQQYFYGDACSFALIGTEMGFDKDQARKAGVKVAFSEEEIEAKALARYRSKRPELTAKELDALRTQVGEFVIVPPSTAEEGFQICSELVASNDFNIVSIDSFGSILAKEDQDKDFSDEPRVAGPSKLNTQLMRKLNSSLAGDEEGNPNTTCIIATNQVRDNLKAQAFMKKTHEGGGWALKHGRFVTIELTRTAWAKRGSEKIGKVIKWEITKQKAGGHDGHTGSYVLEWGPPLRHQRGDLAVTLGAAAGLLKKKGSHYSYDGIPIGNGLAAAGGFFDAHPEELEELEMAIMTSHNVAYVLGA